MLQRWWGGGWESSLPWEFWKAKSFSCWAWRILLCLTHATLIKSNMICSFDAVEFGTLNTSTYQSAFVSILPHFKLTSLRHDNAARCGLTCQLVINLLVMWVNVLGLYYALKCWVLLCPCNWWCWGRECEIRGCKLLTVRSCRWQLSCGLTMHTSLPLHQHHPYSRSVLLCLACCTRCCSTPITHTWICNLPRLSARLVFLAHWTLKVMRLHSFEASEIIWHHNPEYSNFSTMLLWDT